MTVLLSQPKRPIVYPESDGQPMGENTLQWQWIVALVTGLETVFHHDPDVFVAGDLFWYPVEGETAIVQAPDAMVALGRPKGHRGSYKQWEEGNIAPQVVFEVRSPSNRVGQLIDKFRFYERHGVAEYYFYDPEANTLEGWLRANDELRSIPNLNGWTSPRLKVRFELDAATMHVFGPDGREFLTFQQLVEVAERAETERLRAEAERSRAEAERSRAEAERSRAEAEQLRSARLAAQLRALGVEPEV